jgi:hypothetical protein
MKSNAIQPFRAQLADNLADYRDFVCSFLWTPFRTVSGSFRTQSACRVRSKSGPARTFLFRVQDIGAELVFVDPFLLADLASLRYSGSVSTDG